MDSFLERNRTAKGSSSEMTENTYTMDEVWLVMTPKVMEFIHAMTYIYWNPQWLVLEISYGFGPHIYRICALEL